MNVETPLQDLELKEQELNELESYCLEMLEYYQSHGESHETFRPYSFNSE
jgi:hypothetical protein